MPPNEMGIAERTEEIAWRACLAQERADRCGQSFSNENLSSQANQTDVTDAPSGKTSPHASGSRTAAIMDGCHPLYSARPTFLKFITLDILSLGVPARGDAAK